MGRMGVACGVLVAGVALWAAAAEPVVAVMPFEGPDTTETTRGIGREMSEHVATFLGQAPAIRVVERAQMDKVFAEMALQQSGVIDEQHAAEAGKMAGATHLVVGRFARDGGSVQVKARLVEVQSGTVAGSAMTEGKEQEKALNEASIKLAEALGMQVTPNRAFKVKRTLGWTSTGLCLVAGGLAVWSFAAYSAADEEYRTSYNLSAAQYDDLASTADLHQELRWYFGGSSLVLLGVGVVMLATNRTEWLFTPREMPAAMVVPFLGPNGPGVCVTVALGAGSRREGGAQ